MLLLILSSLIVLSTEDTMSSNCAALWQLDGLSECVIHQKYTAYQNYGCVCSNVNTQTPLDNIDRCCASHIQCYNNLMNNCANPDAPNFCSYRWTCDSSQIICENNSSCLQDTCKCDKRLIDCLSQYSFPSITKTCPHTQHIKDVQHPKNLNINVSTHV